MNHIRHAKYREQVVVTLDYCFCSHILASKGKGKSCIFIYYGQPPEAQDAAADEDI